MNFKIAKTSSVRKKLIYTGMSLLLAVILIAVNLLVDLIPWKFRAPSLNDDTVFTLSASTKTLLSSLEEDVTLYLICENGEMDTDRDLFAFLMNYETLSPHISVEILDSKTEADFLSSHGINSLAEGEICFLVESARRHMLLSLSDLYYYYYSDDEGELYLSATEYATSAETLSSMGYTMSPYFNGEEGVSNAIRFVTLEKVPVVAIIQSAYQAEDGSIIPLNAELNSALVQSLRQNNCDIRYILSTSDLTEEHEVLIFNSPLLDLTKQETADLNTWLENGGSMILTTYFNTMDQPNLMSVLKNYGLSADEKYIRINEDNPAYQYGNSYVAKLGTHETTVSVTDSVIVSDAHAIYFDPTSDQVEFTPLLYTTSLGSKEKYDSSNKTWTEIEADPTSYTYGAVVEKENSKIVWVSTPYLFDLADPFIGGGNHQLLLSSIDWMSDASISTIDTQATAMETDVLLVSVTAFLIWLVLLVIILPLSFLSIGLVRRHIRKKG